jgi:5-methylcytosine-specific restriction protein A
MLSRCSRCARRRRGTTSQRGYGAAHQRRARRAIALEPWCSTCGSTRDVTADHVIPLAHGGDPLGPLRVLCRSCNSQRGTTTLGAVMQG